MPAPLAKAHANLDHTVEKCYRAEAFHSDRERVEHLFALYEKLTTLFLTPKTKTRARRTPARPIPASPPEPHPRPARRQRGERRVRMSAGAFLPPQTPLASAA